MARTKTNTQNDTKTITTSWRNIHLEKLYCCVFRPMFSYTDAGRRPYDMWPRLRKFFKIVRCPGDYQIRRWCANRWNRTMSVLFVTIAFGMTRVSLLTCVSIPLYHVSCVCFIKMATNSKIIFKISHQCFFYQNPKKMAFS